MKQKLRIPAFVVPLLLTCVALVADSPPEQAVKVAEGEYLYEMDGKAVLTQKWILWRLENGGYEEENHWETRAAGKPSVTFQTSLMLGTDLRPLSLEGMPSPKKDVGETKCRFASDKVRCEWPSQEKKLEFPAREPYDVFALHPWFFSGMVRRAQPGNSDSHSLHVYQMVDGSRGYPLSFMARKGEVRWVGREELEISGNKLAAEKYELSLEPVPPMLFWVTAEGVMLVMEDESPYKNHIKLVRYKKYAEFGAGK